MANVEIYIENPNLDQVVSWVNQKLTSVLLEHEDYEAIHLEGKYKGRKVPVIIQKRVEDLPLVGVWFNAEFTPWETDRDCALEAFKEFNLPVQCDPGEEYTQPNEFLQIDKDGERIITIEPQAE